MEVVLLDKAEPALNHSVARVRAVKQDFGVDDAAHTIEAQKMREANKTLVKSIHLFTDDGPFELSRIEETTSHRKKT